LKVKVIEERGYEEALLGLGLSHDISRKYMFLTDNHPAWEMTAFDYRNNEVIENKPPSMAYLEEIARSLAHAQGGHNKFLESIQVWFVVEATLKFWDQFDTYRVGITKQSDSMMHTILKRGAIKKENCGKHVDQRTLDIVNEYIECGDFEGAVENAPVGFHYTRLVNCNYKTLQNIIYQRKNHKWYEWREFCVEILKQIAFPEYLIKDKKKGN